MLRYGDVPPIESFWKMEPRMSGGVSDNEAIQVRNEEAASNYWPGAEHAEMPRTLF